MACSDSIRFQFASENCADDVSFAIPGLDLSLIMVTEVSLPNLSPVAVSVAGCPSAGRGLGTSSGQGLKCSMAAAPSFGSN